MAAEWRELDLAAHDVCGAPYGGAVAVVRQPRGGGGASVLVPLKAGEDPDVPRLSLFTSAGVKISDQPLARDAAAEARRAAAMRGAGQGSGAGQRIVGLGWTEREELLLVAEASRRRVASRRIASRRIATSSSRRRRRRAVAL